MRVAEPAAGDVILVLDSYALWTAHCMACGWTSEPSLYLCEAKADAYDHRHPAHRLPIELLATAYDVEQRNHELTREGCTASDSGVLAGNHRPSPVAVRPSEV